MNCPTCHLSLARADGPCPRCGWVAPGSEAAAVIVGREPLGLGRRLNLLAPAILHIGFPMVVVIFGVAPGIFNYTLRVGAPWLGMILILVLLGGISLVGLVFKKEWLDAYTGKAIVARTRSIDRAERSPGEDTDYYIVFAGLGELEVEREHYRAISNDEIWRVVYSPATGRVWECTFEGRLRQSD